MLMKETLHTCDVCKQESTVSTIFDVDNLFRKNMMNVKKAYKTNPCEGIYDSDKDSYCSLVEWEEFKKNYNKYIDKAIDKREHKERYTLGRYPVVCRSWRKSTLRNMFLFLFHYLEKVSSLSCGPVEIYDRSRYQQWRYDCDPEAIEKKMGKQR